MKLFELTKENEVKNFLIESVDNTDDALYSLVETCIKFNKTPEEVIFDFAYSKLNESNRPLNKREAQILSSLLIQKNRLT